MAAVNGISDHGANRGVTPQCCAALGLDALLIEPICKAMQAIALIHHLVIKLCFYGSLRLIAYQVFDWLALFIYSPSAYGVEAEGNHAAVVFTGNGHLCLLFPNTYGSFLTFTGCLPEANVIEQLVHMIVKTLLALLDTPDSDAMGNEPLYYEGCFVVAAAQTVKHENQQYIEFSGQCIYL